METTIGLPKTVLADAGFASGPAVADLQARGIEPLVAIGRTQPHRSYDFRPPPEPKPARQIAEPWRLGMKAKLETEDGKHLYKKRKQTVEPVFGIIKSAMIYHPVYIGSIGLLPDNCSARPLGRGFGDPRWRRTSCAWPGCGGTRIEMSP